MRIVTGTALGTLITLVSTVALANSTYRLAGIITPDSGDALALIELPDGAQQLVRAGDRIGEGRVVSVTDRLVRLQLHEGEIVLELVQSDRERPDALATQTSGGPVMVDGEGRARIEKLAAEAGRLTDEELARELASELRLSSRHRIAAINGKPVESAAEVVRAIADEFAQPGASSPVKLVVSFAEPAEDHFRIYYFQGRADGSPQSE
ncbi:hypothetical protein [Lentisalinibacter salinarum]|uniref:hypothetical protein n=1 Tax=Lentisalinibacter salinarum TaxID=2992239 RepID=UPI0038663A40